jgi:hypothetical protein
LCRFGNQHLRDFLDNEKTIPTILTTWGGVGSGETHALIAAQISQLIADALADLGQAEEIGQVFTGFQKYLYQHQAVA